MTRLLIVFLLLCCSILSSCNEDCRGFKIGSEFEIAVNEALENCPENISITISEIQDSRCPSDGNCIWAGMIMVDGELQVDGTVYDLQLSNNPQASGFQEEFSTSEFTIKLIDAIPYPNFSNLGKAADKRVILIVSKRST